jgi:putative oxidoreductase
MMKSLVAFISRLLVSLIFLVGGFQKLLHFSQTQAVIAQHGLPMVKFCAAGATFLEIVGGLALVFGIKTKPAALVLAIYLIPTTLVFHGHIGDPAMLTQFLKNAAIIGGLLMIWAFGAGDITLDKTLKIGRS